MIIKCSWAKGMLPEGQYVWVCGAATHLEQAGAALLIHTDQHADHTQGAHVGMLRAQRHTRSTTGQHRNNMEWGGVGQQWILGWQ